MPLSIIAAGFVLAAAAVPAIAQSEDGCMADLVKQAPYLEGALQQADIPSTTFTMFLPTEQAATQLATALAAEGCSQLPTSTIGSIMDAAIVPGAAGSDAFDTPVQYTFRTGEGPMTLRVAMPDDFLVVETIDPAMPDAVADVALGAPAGLDTPVCGGRGMVHMVDDVIMPPSLVSEVQDAAEGAATGECPLAAQAAEAEPAAGDAEDADDYVPLEEALVTGVDIDLESPSATASNQVEATLLATATDADGGTIDIDETIILGVDAELTETEGGGKGGPPTNVELSVPVNVGVFVEPTEECEIASVSVPVTVAVDIELVVAGTMLGKGHTDMKYAPCAGKLGGKWDECGGKRVGDKGGVEEYRYGCKKGLQCVKKNDFYAACMTPKAARTFREERGWDGMILKCRMGSGKAAPASGSPGGYGK